MIHMLQRERAISNAGLKPKKQTITKCKYANPWMQSLMTKQSNDNRNIFWVRLYEYP